MVVLPIGYCIDSTEVTIGQYQAWLGKSPTTSNQISVCASWNTSYTPNTGCLNSQWACLDANCPQVCVNWCDAYAYCAAVGKRLCGKIGGGSNGYNDHASAALSQWYASCTSNGKYSATSYPYGDTYQGTYCNGNDHWGGNSALWKTVAVGSMTSCQSTQPGYAGVYDLSGNISEWEDSCDGTTGPNDNCWRRGGGFNNASDYMQCDTTFSDTRNSDNGAFGFRCCSL